MGKKRRVRWIVGGAVCFVVLLAVGYFMIQYRTPESRLLRELDAIIDEYGFSELDSNYENESFPDVLWAAYRSSEIGAVDAMFARLKAECDGCDVVTYPGTYPNEQTYLLRREEDSGPSMSVLLKIEHTPNRPINERWLRLQVWRHGQDAPWAKFRRWLPR